MKCAATGAPYTVFGYKGKQVRDNIHSLDLLRAFDAFRIAPKSAAVYNIGGGRHSNCSMLEAIRVCETIANREMISDYDEANRVGDHIWWICGLNTFEHDFPDWAPQHSIVEILWKIYEYNRWRWKE